jgi:HEAT repeat protein
MNRFRWFAVLSVAAFSLWFLSGCGEEENKDLLKARRLIHSGQFQDASQSVQAALQSEPENVEALCLREVLSVRGKRDPEAWRTVMRRCLRQIEPMQEEIEELQSKEEPDEDELKRLERLIRSRNYAMGFLAESFAELVEEDEGWVETLFESDPDLVVKAMLTSGKCYDEEVRRKVEMVIIKMAQRAVKPLISQLKSDDPAIEAQAVYYLGLLGAREAIGPITELASSDSSTYEVMYQIPVALELIGGREIATPLINLLKGQYAQPKIYAAKLLARIKAKEAIPELVELLAAPNSYVVTAAKDALISFGSSSVEPLLHVLKTRAGDIHLPPSSRVTEDKEKSARNSVVGAAMDVLASIGDGRAVREIASFLSDDDLRGSASSALIKFGPASTASMIQALRSSEAQVRVAAASVLKSTLDRRAVDALIEALSDPDKEVAAMAASALGAMKVREAIPHLTRLLSDIDERIRDNVLTALNTIAYYDPEMVKAVLGIAKDKNERESIRISALTVLKTVKPSEVGGDLIEIMMADDETPDVRRAAVAALGEIKPQEALDPMLRIISALREKPKDYQRLLKRRYKEIDAFNREWGTDYRTWAEIKPIPSLVRSEVALALGKIKGDEVVEPLIKALEDDDRAMVRKSAAWALGEIKGDKVIGPLIKAMKDDDVGVVRNEAAVALGKIASKKAVGALIRTLKKDKYETARKNAAWALSEIKDKSAVGDLIDVLSDKGKSEEERESDAVIAQVETALINIGSPSVESLVGLLDHEEAYVRARAVYCLGKIGDETALEDLMRVAANDESPMVRGYAITALANFKTRNVVKAQGEGLAGALDSLLDEEEWKTNRAKAAETLGKIKDERGVEPLVQAAVSDLSELRNKAIVALGNIGDYRGLDEIAGAIGTETDLTIRANAIAAAAKYGDLSVEEALLSVLNEELTSQTLSVHEAAVSALGDIGSKKAVTKLISVLQDRSLPTSLRAKAAKALGQIKDPAASKALLERLNDESEYDDVWEEVAIALGRELKVKEAAPAIIKRLKDTWEAEGLRATVAEALGGTGTDEAIETLKEMLSDSSESVRGNAALGLGHSGRVEVIQDLIDIMQNSGKAESERYKAAKALGNFRGQKVVEALIQTLNDTSAQESVRKNAATSLGQIATDEAVQALIEAYHKTEYPIGLRRTILSALGESGNPKAVSTLQEAIKEEDSVLHYNAAKSLFKITGDAPGYRFGG